MQKRSLLFLSAVALLLLLSACNFPTATPTDSMDVIKTAAAQTVEAMTTDIAKASPTVSLPTATARPTDVPLPTDTPVPTNVPLPTFTPTAIVVCDCAAFIKESVPDSSDFFPGSVFTKTWTIKNTGTCTWNANYAVVFTGGTNSLNASASLPITTGTVAPGETVLISMNLTAPATAGTYRAEFKLRNASNVIFGTGDASKSFWAEIDVIDDQLNLAENVCAAEWSSAAGILACPGKDGDSNGFVYVDNNPMLENGAQDDEPALWTAPQNTNNGTIKAIFAAQKIPSGMVFKSIIGCAPTATDCNVVMTLNYRESGGAIINLATWAEIYDGLFNRVSYDLGALAGKNVQIILTVDANGSASGDKVHWLMPSIESYEANPGN